MLVSGNPRMEASARRSLVVRPVGPQRPQPAVAAFVKFQGDARVASLGNVIRIEESGRVMLKSDMSVWANPTMIAGATPPFTATGAYTGNITQNITNQVTWASSVPGVAAINAFGLATGGLAGTTTISASLGAVSGSTLLTVAALVCSASQAYTVPEVQATLNQALGISPAENDVSGAFTPTSPAGNRSSPGPTRPARLCRRSRCAAAACGATSRSRRCAPLEAAKVRPPSAAPRSPRGR